MAAALQDAIEFIPDRLYYVTLRSDAPEDDKRGEHFWSSDEFKYWNFFLDWGPLSLGNLYRFCRTLNSKLRSDRLKDKAIYVFSGSHAHKRANAAFLLCAWQLLYRGKSPEEALLPFTDTYPPFPPFHDASPCVCTYDLTILDCLRGLARSCYFRFFDFHTFAVEEYEHFEQVENGDLNWLVEGKFLAFAGPHNRSEVTKEGYRTLTPKDYIPYFKEHNVTLVVRLNKKYYDEKSFLDAGIDHEDAYFLDGSVPPPYVLQKFMAACEATPGAIAVHCKVVVTRVVTYGKMTLYLHRLVDIARAPMALLHWSYPYLCLLATAGLGRTGTCIGCYLMKHYGFTAPEVIGWMRICRPGSVIGPQQHYLQRMEGSMHREGIALRERSNPTPTRGRATLYGARDTARGAGTKTTLSFSQDSSLWESRWSRDRTTTVATKPAMGERSTIAASPGWQGEGGEGDADAGWVRQRRPQKNAQLIEIPPGDMATASSRAGHGLRAGARDANQARAGVLDENYYRAGGVAVSAQQLGGPPPTSTKPAGYSPRREDDVEYIMGRDFSNLTMGEQRPAAVAASLANLLQTRRRESSSKRRESAPATMGSGSGSGGSASGGGGAGARTRLPQKEEVSAASPATRRLARSRLLGERPLGIRLGDVWEGAGSGRRTQGDMLRERRVVRETGAGARGM